MPFNGTGVFQRLYNWVNDAAQGILVNAQRMDADTNDIADALSNCVTRDGQSLPLVDLPMGGKRFTGLGSGVAAGDSVNYGQVFNSPIFMAPAAANIAGLGNPNPLVLATIQDVLNAANSSTLPAQTGNAGKVLTTDGTNVSWQQSLPVQTNNAGKVLTTDGTNVSWQQGLPVQTNNAGKFLVTNGTSASWSNAVRDNNFQIVDGFDPTKIAIFSTVSIPTGTVRSYQLPGAGGLLALRTDTPPANPVMIVREQRPAGTDAGTNQNGVNIRQLNTVVKNTITGASLSGTAITLPVGTYRINANAAASGGSTANSNHKIYFTNAGGQVLLVGSAEFAQVGSVTQSTLADEIVLTAITALTLRHYIAPLSTFSSGTGKAVGDGTAEIYAQVIIEKVA